MGHDERKHLSKKRAHDVTAEQEHRRKKRHRDREEEASGSSKSKRKEKKSSGSTRIVDEDVNDDDMWEEKNIDLEGEIVRSSVLCGYCRGCNMRWIAFGYGHSLGGESEANVSSVRAPG
jgi:hypothetical protein